MDSTTVNVKFGEYIRSARVNKKIMQKELAKKLDITPAYYCQIENGKRNTDFFLAMKICDILELDLNDFVRALKN